MFERLSQPMHLLAIFGIALLVFEPKSFRNVGRDQRGNSRRQERHARREQANAAREQQTSTSSTKRLSTTCA
jgi:Sec-independent protein translocase protein TatA